MKKWTKRSWKKNFTRAGVPNFSASHPVGKRLNSRAIRLNCVYKNSFEVVLAEMIRHMVLG